jgi:hypothetical protein
VTGLQQVKSMSDDEQSTFCLLVGWLTQGCCVTGVGRLGVTGVGSCQSHYRGRVVGQTPVVSLTMNTNIVFNTMLVFIQQVVLRRYQGCTEVGPGPQIKP